MATCRVGLGQNNLKLSRLGFYDHRTIKARPTKVAVGGGRFFRRPCVVACGGGANGLVSDSYLSVNTTSMFHHNMAVRKRMMDKEDDGYGKINMWILNSIKEILNKIEEAPFLVHIYPQDDQGSRQNNTKNVREKVSANSWPDIKHRWEIGSSIPNGIALVEELKIDDDHFLPGHGEKLGILSNDDGSTKVFGIVIQEKGLGYPACYILKTVRVRSISGICTHFCIFRAECFGETVDEQIKKHWLV